MGQGEGGPAGSAGGLSTVCVFCGSSRGRSPSYAAAADGFGRLLAARGIGLVYGGGHVGLMGVVADAVLRGGGRVTGVITRALQEREVAHLALSELLVVETMHQRKAAMADRSDAFVMLPGGLGTFEEVFEVVTWSQLGIHGKPCGVLDVDGYFDPLVAMLDRATEEGFIRGDHRQLLPVDADPERLLDRLAAWRPPPGERWLDDAQR